VKPHLVRILAGLALSAFFLGHVVGAYRVGFIEQLDNIIYDARLRITVPGKADPRVVILDIDERSLGEHGRWPWSRALMARLLDRLFERYGVAAVGFDVVWAEPETLEHDAAFAASMKGRAVVLGYYLSSDAPVVRANALPPPVLPKDAFSGRDAPITRWTGYTGNLSLYVKNASGAGHFNPIIDDDGVVRRVPLLAEIDGAYYEAFSLALARAWLARDEGGKLPEVRPGFPQGQGGYSRLEWLSLGGRLSVPVDEQAAALVPYAGKRGTFTYLSLADVLADRVKPEQLRGKLAIIGASAPGLLDLRATPVGNVYPGVEVHANLVAGILGGTLKMKPGYMVGAEAAFVLLGGLVFSLLLPALSALWATLAAAAGLALITAIDVALWTEAEMVLPLACSILMTAALYTMNMAYGYFVETRTRRRVAARFGEYVPPELVDRIVADPARYSMEPKAAELTILFADVRGFTGISEALEPDQLREYINLYLTEMSRIIRSRHRGTLDKYIGDAIMAFWGAPVEDPRHARNGVLAALEMQRECKVLNEKLASRGWPALKIGVGVNTGSVRVGDMGSRVRRAYTAMGDAVNVASRLEGRTKYYGVGILVGEATRNAARDMPFREVDRIKVKGKDTAISVYEPIEAGRNEELQLWNEVLSAYRAQQWDAAEANLRELQRVNAEDGLYRVFADRIAEMRRTPPPAGWDGVTVFDEK